MPVILYGHGTTLLKDGVASEFAGHEWAIAAAAAAYYGYAVAMPDEPGMGGDGAAYHPYCHGKSLAYAFVDAIPAVRDLFGADPYVLGSDYHWDGRVFLLGYSEGGYAALAAAREMETHKEDFGGEAGFILAGSACMAGPFDISGTTRRAILAQAKPFGHPFFIPYVILGYNSVYGNVMDPLEILAPELLETREDGNILGWSNGFTDGMAVNARIAKRLGVAVDGVVARTLLNPKWVDACLADPAFASSPIRDLLQENDVSVGWAPSRPILFCQSPDDADVPVENTLTAMANLEGAMRKAGRDPAGILDFRPLGAPGCGIGHVGGILLAMPAAFDWIYRRRPEAEAEPWVLSGGYAISPANP